MIMEPTLVQKLVSELTCPMCFRRMLRPRQCVTGHNYCTNCSECFNESVQYDECKSPTLRNYSLERICFRIALKCSFATAGCHFTGNGMEVSLHEKICDYSLKFCPLNMKNTVCKWVGHNRGMKEHCDSVHSGDIVKNNVCTISTDLEYLVDQYSTTLISVYDSIFCCTWHLGTATETAYLYVKYVGSPFENDRYGYELNIMKGGNAIVTFKGSCSHLADLWKPFSKSDFSISSSVLQEHCVDSGKLEYSIRLVKYDLPTTIEAPFIEKDTSAISIEEALLVELECPICYSTIVPPINQCTIGHQTCNDCFQQIEECPICRGPKAFVTNISLERFCSMFEWKNGRGIVGKDETTVEPEKYGAPL